MPILDFFRREKPAAQPRIAPTFRQRTRPLRRDYNAAANNLQTSSWGSAPKSADQVVYQNLETLRARSREQQYNNDFVRRFIQLIRVNVAGAEGVRVQSKAVHPGRKAEADSDARQAIEREFKRWSRAEHCHLQGQQSWVELQQLAMATIAGDGEVLVREHSAGPYGYQLELIDPQLLDVKYCENLKNGRRIVFGIEYSPQGRAVAYHLLQPSDSPHTYTHSSGQHYLRVPAGQIRHLFLADFVGQKRGIPWTATGLLRLKMIGAFEDAALTNARVGASKMGWIKEDGSESAYVGDDQPGGDFDPHTGDDIETMEPAYIGRLAPGEDFVGFDPAYPSGEFGPFVKSCLRSVAAGLGVSYHSLAQDLEGVNYSSAKVGELVDKEIWMALQNWLTERLVQPVFEEWLERQHALGTIKIGNTPLGRPLEYYRPARYQPKRWKDIDPLKAVNARREAVALGIAAPQMFIVEDGNDPDEVATMLAEWAAMLEKLGLPLPQALAAPAAKAPPAATDPEQAPDNPTTNGTDDADQ